MTLPEQIEMAKTFQRKLLEGKSVDINLQEFLKVSQWFEAMIESLQELSRFKSNYP